MTGPNAPRGGFRKSSYSEGGGCVEACAHGTQCLVRDSKDPDGGVLIMGQDVWAAMVSQIKQGAYDL